MNHAELLASALLGSTDLELLDEAARHAAVRRTQIPTRDIEAPPVAPSSTSPEAPAGFCRVMQRMLAEKSAGLRSLLVTEALQMVAKAEQVIPVTLLVPLLEAARGDSKMGDTRMAEALAGVLGERGRWLAAQHPIWQALHRRVEPEPSAWDEGATQERVAWLRHLRASDPAAGRELVASAKGEKAADRAQFIAALEVGLSHDDEELLDSAVASRSKEVAKTAAELLSRLPSSTWSQRLEEVAAGIFSPGENPVAVAPSTSVVSANRYLDVAAATGHQVSNTPEGRVLAIVSLLNPRAWIRLCGVDAQTLASRGAQLDGEVVELATSLIHATIRWRDVELARALYPITSDFSLLPVLPAKERNDLIAAQIKTTDRRDLVRLVATLPTGELDAEVAVMLMEVLVADVQGAKDYAVGRSLCEVISQRANPIQAESWIPRFRELAADTSLRYQSAAATAATCLTLRVGALKAIHHKEHR